MGALKTTFIIILCVLLGASLGVWISHEYNIDGVPDLWKKLTDLFKKTSDSAQQAIKEKLNN